MQKTNIEYLSHSWNPIAMRCTPWSRGCWNCWHLRMANRHGNNYSFCPSARKAYAGGDPWLNTDELAAPLRRRKPARIGVQFMGDLFHYSIPREWIAAIYGVMAASPQHTFFVLTKRLQEMSNWYKWVDKREQQGRKLFPHDDAGWRIRQMLNVSAMKNGVNMPSHHGGPWPPENVIIGCSVENQPSADKRIPLLLQVPANKRWVSYEPTLDEVNFRYVAPNEDWHIDALATPDESCRVNLVVAGAETGPDARPCNLDNLRSARDQCADAGVPFFLKAVNAKGDPELDGRKHEEMI